MATNVQFLKGLSSNLPSTSVNGAFYLTTDDCRLYYGTGSGAPVLLNEQINVVSAVAALPTVTGGKMPDGKNAAGVIYYATAENILCIYDGVNNKWQQINADTDTSVKSFVVSAGEYDEDNKRYDYTLTLTEKNKKGDTVGTPFVSHLYITDDMVANLAVDVKVGLTSTAVASNATVIKTVGTGIDDTKVVNIKGGTNVTLSGTADNLTIAATDTKYDLLSSINGETVTIKLDSANDDPNYVKFEAGAKVDLKQDATDTTKYVISHETSAAEAKETKASINKASTNAQVITIPSVEIDAYGHVISNKTTDVTVDNTTYTQTKPTVGSQAGSIKVGLTDNKTNTVYAESDQIFYNKITVDGAETTVYNQGNLGSFYSKTWIDNKLKDLDAFRYKGTVASASDLTAKTDVEIGDTYKASAAFDLTNSEGKTERVHIGDIIISNGSETNGIITTPTWDVLHTENNTDTTYVLSAKNDGTLGDRLTLTGTSGDPYNIQLKDDSIVEVTVIDADEVKFSHATSGVTAQKYGGEGTATLIHGGTIQVPNFTVNATGHITQAGVDTYTLPSEKSYSIVTDATNDKITIKQNTDTLGTITYKDNTYINLDVTGTGANAVIEAIHNDVNRVDPAAVDKTLVFGQNFTVVTAVTSDDKGHITGVQLGNMAMPAQSDCVLSGANVTAITGGVAVKSTLSNQKGDKSYSTLNLTSTSLEIKKGATDAEAVVNLVWGEFPTA